MKTKQMSKSKASTFLLGLLLWACAPWAWASPTLDVVRLRGSVACGTTTGVEGFSAPDEQGVWHGLDVDVCRAVAAAIFGDAERVKVVPLNSQQRFLALQNGNIDLLARNTSITQERDTALGIIHAGINYYDGLGFLVPRSLGVSNAREFKAPTICLQAATNNEVTLADWAMVNGLSYEPYILDTFGALLNAFLSGRCDAISTDISGLASVRASRLPQPDEYVILPDIISKEPLGPFVRQGDDAWLNIVRWSLQAMIAAEELGVTSKNIDQMQHSSNPEVLRLLGVIPGAGKNMGLDEQWAYRIIKQVGNYGESFDRNVGEGSPLKLPRGLNRQWRDGGLMYALPIR
ncbi:amino acid ABC transporter substrate-binding protein [Achromobacter xylosoxidans]